MTLLPGASPDVRVSVVITSYNHERYIARALEGVLEQRGVTYEVLVGDDCSTDGTRSIISDFARLYPNLIRPVFPPENMGSGGKVLFADLLQRSRGRYIAGLDGDDYWTSPDKLRVQAEYLDEHPECSMCFHNAIRRTDDGGVRDVLYNPPGQPRQLSVGHLLGANPVAACAPVFRREAIHPLPAWYFTMPWGDLPLYFLAARSGEMHFLPEVMGVYRVHAGGMYSGLPSLRQFEFDVEFLEGLSGILPMDEDSHRRRRLAVVLSWMARECIRQGDRKAARRRLAQSFQAWPADPRRLRRGQGERLRWALWMRVRLPAHRWSDGSCRTDRVGL